MIKYENKRNNQNYQYQKNKKGIKLYKLEVINSKSNILNQKIQ